VNGGLSAATVALTAGGDLVIGGGASITGVDGVTLASSARFINNGGANALNGGSTGCLVYSANPANDSVGGLAPDFYQYAAGVGVTPAAAGNGLLYALAPTLEVTLSTAPVTMAYDGTNLATFGPASATVAGLMNGDTAVVTGTYSGKNVGSGLEVTASTISITHGGASVYGYGGTAPTVSANVGQIDRATVTAIIVGDPTKTYNGTTTAALSAANYQLAGFVTGEGATVNQPSSIAYDLSEAGARTLNATFTSTNFVANPGTDFGNYILPVSATGAGTILQAPLLISGVTALDKVYDQSTAAALSTGGAGLYGVIGSDNVGLVTTGATGTFSTANAGTAIAVETNGFALTGTRAANYRLIQPSGITATITPRGLTLVGVTAYGKIYDGTSAATLDSSNAALVPS
jgi:hypothetical protein